MAGGQPRGTVAAAGTVPSHSPAPLQHRQVASYLLLSPASTLPCPPCLQGICRCTSPIRFLHNPVLRLVTSLSHAPQALIPTSYTVMAAADVAPQFGAELKVCAMACRGVWLT